MYRLLKVRAVSLPRVPPLNVVPNAFKCGASDDPVECSRSLDRLQSRFYSSTINTVILSSESKKKIKRKAKRYAELLEVTESVTSNRKAAVQKLNAAQLSILVDQPDITLDKLHKLQTQYSKKKNKLGTTSSFSTSAEKSMFDHVSDSSIKSFPEMSDNLSFHCIEQLDQINSMAECTENNSEILLEGLELSESISNNLPTKSLSNNEDIDIKPKKIKKRKKEIELEKTEEMIQERKEKEELIFKEKLKQFNKVVLGYMDVCVNSNSLDCGLKVLSLYKKRKSRNNNDLLYINDVKVFNLQIRKLAYNKDWSNISSILNFLRRENISFNYQTYAHIFDCIGRMDMSDDEKLHILKQIEQDMLSDQISLNDIMTKSIFLRDERVYAEKMVKFLNSNFNPIYKISDKSYDCNLLRNFNEENATPSSTVENLLTISDLKKRLETQIKAEMHGLVEVKSIAKQNKPSKNVTLMRNKLENLEKVWQKQALEVFERNLNTLKNREIVQRGNKMVLFPYLTILKPEDYISVLMREVRNLAMGSEMYSLPFNFLCRQMGVQVFKIYEAKLKNNDGIIDKVSEVYLQYCDWFMKKQDKCNGRSKWMDLEHRANMQGVTLGSEVPPWQHNVHVNLGKFLFEIIFNDLKLDSNYLKNKKPHGHIHTIPAFFKVYRHSGVMLMEEVKPHPLVAKLYRESQPETLTFDTTRVPSLCPPRPWTSISSGGYIVTKTDIVRVSHFGNQQWDRLVGTKPNKLYPALDSLNQLASVPWTVNSAVLDVAIQVFQNDGSVELDMPQPPTVLAPIAPAPKGSDPNEKKKIDKARMELKRKKNEMYSLWCDALYRLSLANHYRDDMFWLPHNMDFRGRVYPIPPHLNHLGSDLARSMLVFALKKPLGPNGLDWLKLHTINLTGFKKRNSISERLEYANEIMDKILDSAEKPLTGEMWWSKSDEPWQTLAACMEISQALKSPNPAEYMSGFPVHQDGSCNGLQHYAALGRDKIGAESVNLCPSERPQDVYNSVSTMVDKLRKEDAANGNRIAQALEGFVSRKVIKQTVMTTVYGVTWFGAKLQIARQLKDLDKFPQEHLWPASTYLVQKTFQTLRTMFKSAREIQDWFTECARLVCTVRGQNMEWITPLGLPVVQPYSKIHRTTGNKSLSPLFSPDIYRRPNVMKQKNAFAPNYVHSLDSSHMMLTSIFCEHAGITYVSVHDCYWTHPCTVEIMNKICREQFVALHSEPILEDLSKFLVQNFATDNIIEPIADASDEQLQNMPMEEKLFSTLKKVPEQGDLDLNGVLSSTYFFS